jgi:hypothetical protein
MMEHVCSTCGGPTSRMTRTGICWSCHLARRRLSVSTQSDIDAEQGSRALLEGYNRYWRNHVEGRGA